MVTPTAHPALPGRQTGPTPRSAAVAEPAQFGVPLDVCSSRSLNGPHAMTAERTPRTEPTTRAGPARRIGRRRVALIVLAALAGSL